MRARLNRIRAFCLRHKAVSLLVVAAGGLAAAVGTYAAVEATSTVEFCIRCHEMRPAYEAYLASSHYRVADASRRADCRDCHVPPWSHPVGVLWTKTYHGVKDVARHLLDGPETLRPGYQASMAASAPHGIHNAACLACHADVAAEVYPGRSNIHALLRDSRNSRCTDCHRRLVH